LNHIIPGNFDAYLENPNGKTFKTPANIPFSILILDPLIIYLTSIIQLSIHINQTGPIKKVKRPREHLKKIMQLPTPVLNKSLYLPFGPGLLFGSFTNLYQMLLLGNGQVQTEIYYMVTFGISLFWVCRNSFFE